MTLNVAMLKMVLTRIVAVANSLAASGAYVLAGQAD